jgi:RNA polymerase sigma factor (sigma-70 family)
MHAAAVLASRTPRIVAWSRMGDEALAARAAAGSAAAFTALYERYHGPLLGYCRSILLNAEDAGDATQNALENALRALPRREPGRPLRPWLYRIAHNESINIIRRRRPIDDSGVDPATLLTVPGPEAESEQRTRLALLVDDLRMLPERQRGALVMRELSGLSYDEIGLALGVSNEAARRAVFDARSALHDALDGHAAACTSVRRTLSDGDRRRLRARGIRAHLRSCDDCATFERAIGVRQFDLHALGPWLGGSAALGLIGAGGAGAGGTIAVTGGGGLWSGLPVGVKGLAVAAVVATSGTAAVELPKVTAPDAPARQGQAATAGGASAAPASAAQRHARHRQASAHAPAARRARRAPAHRPAAMRVQAGAGGASSTPVHGGSQARPHAPAPAAPAASTVATPGAGQSAPAAAKTPQQVAAESLQRIRDKLLAAFTSAQTVAGSGAPGALAAGNSIVQGTLGQVFPSIQRILASVGMHLPPAAATAAAPQPQAPAAPTVTAVLAPARSLLGGVNTLLQKLVGGR